VDRIDDNMIVVIMAGGAGTRFWPLSTEERPKQFVRIVHDRSLLQLSYDRVASLVPDERIIVMTNERFVPLVQEQLPGITAENIIGEPERKDTAAAVCLAALIAKKRFGNPVIVVVTADHVVEPVGVFQRTILSAVTEARRTGALYTFGITPDYPATAYGYVEMGEPTDAEGDVAHYHINSFREKPDEATAKGYVSSGRYLWNAGMFVWTADTVLDALKRYLPEHVTELGAAVDTLGTDKWDETLKSRFAAVNRISIDYAVMEKADNVRCVAGEFSWKDVGGWLAMRDYLPCDRKGNYVKGCLHTRDARNNLVYCDRPEEVVAVVGLNDIVVVRAGDRTLVARNDRLEEIKHIVETMMSENNQ